MCPCRMVLVRWVNPLQDSVERTKKNIYKNLSFHKHNWQNMQMSGEHNYWTDSLFSLKKNHPNAYSLILTQDFQVSIKKYDVLQNHSHKHTSVTQQLEILAILGSPWPPPPEGRGHSQCCTAVSSGCLQSILYVYNLKIITLCLNFCL